MKNINIVLDYRFFDVQDTSGEFNEFVRVFLPWFKEGKKRAETLNLPLKYHKHSLKLKSEGFKRKQAIQLELRDNKFFLNLIWEKEEPQKKENSFKVGIDQGFHKLISDSNGIHWGIELQEIYKRLSKKKRGSKKYKRLLTFKKQKINQTVNRFIKAYPDTDIVCQNLKDVKKVSKLYRSVNNRLQYWSYRQVLDKLENLSSLEGFKVIKVNPAYTSQTCSKCGTVIKSNRQGQIYRCSCGLLIDADTNAAVNILHRGVYSLSQQNPCFH